MKRKGLLVTETTLMMLSFGMLQWSYADSSKNFATDPNAQKVNEIKDEKESEKSLILRLEMIEKEPRGKERKGRPETFD